MNEERAREILKGTIQKDGSLYDPANYIAWSPGDKTVVLDDDFTIEELEAIIWWTRNYGKAP